MVEHEVSSGNVYADLGYEDAEEQRLKSQLVQRIDQEMRARGLTQTEAAKLMGLTQPKLSNLLKGRFRGVSRDKLTRCLIALGYRVTLRFEPQKEAAGGLEVEFA